MAKAKRVSNETVHKLKANGIKSHIKRTFKISSDKRFEAKFWDVIGLLRLSLRLPHLLVAPSSALRLDP